MAKRPPREPRPELAGVSRRLSFGALELPLGLPLRGCLTTVEGPEPESSALQPRVPVLEEA